jgi:arylsulfatase A-like enzyme
MHSRPVLPVGPHSVSLPALSVWFGLVSGWGDYLAIALSERLYWHDCVQPVVSDMIWLVPLFSVALFGLAGIAMALVSHLVPPLRDERLALGFFTFLTTYEWLRLLFEQLLDRYARVILGVGLTVAFLRWFQKHHRVHFWRRYCLAVPLLLMLSFAIAETFPLLRERVDLSRRPAAEVGSPNLLVIVIDTLRADHLSAYKYPRQTSPNIDVIAGEGTLFESSFSTSSWTVPSHASMLTGLYPYEHGSENLFRVRTLPTLGDALIARGYRTAAFSANKVFFTRSCGFGGGFDYFDDYSYSFADLVFRVPLANKIYGKLFEMPHPEAFLSRKHAPEVKDSFLNWVDREKGRPFFAFLNFFDAHDPYITLAPYRNKFARNDSPVDSRGDGSSQNPEEPSGGLDAYDGGIAYVDEYIGELFAQLKKRGLDENTVAVITSDHGESFGERGYFIHGNALFREEIHVPLIFWGPKFVPAGVRIERSVTNAAIPATLMELANFNAPPLFRGPSLSHLWRGTQAQGDWPNTLSELSKNAEAPNVRVPRRYGWIKSLVDGKWHYIMHENLPPMLYNWRDDPEESQNLAETPEGKLLAAEFSVRIQRALSGKDQEK